MSYITLGARTVKGAADTTGTNPGNWTVVFDSNAININQPFFECYKLIVKGAASGATFDVFVNVYQWDTAVYAVHNSWDPSQPLLLRPGDTIYFYYSSASSDGNQPVITAWFRYDPVFTQVYGLRGPQLCRGRPNRLCSSSQATRSSMPAVISFMTGHRPRGT